MGVIKSQSIKNTILSYAGVVIGSVSALLIYPLDREAYGLAAFLYSTAFFFFPFASFGVTSAITKFFPTFKTKNSNHNNGFLFLILTISTVGYLSFLLVFLFFKDFLFAFLGKLGLDSISLSDSYPLILVLLFALIIIYIFTFFLNNHHKIVIPSLFQNFLYKIFLPIVVLLHYFRYIDSYILSIGIVVFFIFVGIALIIYTMLLGHFNLKPVPKQFITPALKSELVSYLSYSSLNSIGHTLAFRIDMVMVAMMLGFSMNGSYGILFTLASTIDIPNKSILQIAAPIISESWNKNNLSKINEIYRKSSLNLVTLGVFLFLGVWLCLDSLLDLSTNTKTLLEVKYIFFFLGLAKLVDMITSVNSQIIIFSKFYKYNLIFILLLGVTNVVSNYFLIKEFNVIGAAIATFFAMLLFNGIKLIFIYVKMGFHPFSINSLKAIFLAIFAYFIAYAVPVIAYPILNILVKGSVFSLIYLSAILYLNIAPEISKLIWETLDKVLAFLPNRKVK